MEIVPADRAGSFLVHLDGMPQSHVDLADPTRLAIDYVRRLGDVLDALPDGPLVVVHVGGAGMTLARYVHATRPGSRQVVLEPNESLTALVRDQLPLPRRSGIRVRAVDGRRGLGAIVRADVVVLDAFADARTPRELLTTQALGQMARIAPTVAMNLVDSAPFDLVRSVVAGFAAAGETGRVVAEEAVLRGRREGNLVLAVGPGASGLTRSLVGSTVRLVEGRTLRDRFGGGRPLTDAEIGWSAGAPPES